MQNKNLSNQAGADDLDNDDLPLGRILSRREVLALFGTAGAAMLVGGVAQAAGLKQSPINAQATATTTAENTLYLPIVRGIEATATPTPTSIPTATAIPGTTPTATSIPACVVQPEQVTEGPYYNYDGSDADSAYDDAFPNRSDIRSTTSTGVVKQGALLVLTFNVSQINDGSCTPLEGARVELWHCDAAGLYSGVANPGNNTEGQDFLRGYQVTDASGQATFTTIYPGWYVSRAVHMHFKVFPTANSVFTSQLFFDEDLTDTVHAQSPYASKGTRDTYNSEDNIYTSLDNPELLLLTITQTSQGYAAPFDIGIDMS